LRLVQGIGAAGREPLHVMQPTVVAMQRSWLAMQRLWLAMPDEDTWEAWHR
jgi:hypothetical protein